MAQNSKFTLQLLEKIGAPLAASIESVALQGDDTDSEAAKIMAQMLGLTVQVSITLNNSLNITEDEQQADSTRLALASLAAPLIGAFYRQNGRVPEDQDIKRMVKSQEAVLAFAENFTPAVEGASRLSSVGNDVLLFDETQASLVVLQALTPVISAIAEFPFGQSEVKLLQDVSAKLQNSATAISKASGSDNKLGELIVLKALAEIYADCHRGETARLSTASDDNRAELSVAPIWEAYETKVAMIEAISGVDGNNSAHDGKSSKPQSDMSASTNVPVEEALKSNSTDDSAPAVAGSPMGFFKAGPEKEEKVEKPPEQDISKEKAEETPSIEDNPASAVEKQSDSAPSSAGPMGFFKPDAQKKDNDTSSE